MLIGPSFGWKKMSHYDHFAALFPLREPSSLHGNENLPSLHYGSLFKKKKKHKKKHVIRFAAMNKVDLVSSKSSKGARDFSAGKQKKNSRNFVRVM